MHKRSIAPIQQETESPEQDWLNVEDLAEVEISSDDTARPIESALLPGRTSGRFNSKCADLSDSRFASVRNLANYATWIARCKDVGWNVPCHDTAGADH